MIRKCAARAPTTPGSSESEDAKRGKTTQDLQVVRQTHGEAVRCSMVQQCLSATCLPAEMFLEEVGRGVHPVQGRQIAVTEDQAFKSSKTAT